MWYPWFVEKPYLIAARLSAMNIVTFRTSHSSCPDWQRTFTITLLLFVVCMPWHNVLLTQARPIMLKHLPNLLVLIRYTCQWLASSKVGQDSAREGQLNLLTPFSQTKPCIIPLNCVTQLTFELTESNYVCLFQSITENSNSQMHHTFTENCVLWQFFPSLRCMWHKLAHLSWYTNYCRVCCLQFGPNFGHHSALGSVLSW